MTLFMQQTETKQAEKENLKATGITQSLERVLGEQTFVFFPAMNNFSIVVVLWRLLFSVQQQNIFRCFQQCLCNC